MIKQPIPPDITADRVVVKKSAAPRVLALVAVLGCIALGVLGAVVGWNYRSDAQDQRGMARQLQVILDGALTQLHDANAKLDAISDSRERASDVNDCRVLYQADIFVTLAQVIASGAAHDIEIGGLVSGVFLLDPKDPVDVRIVKIREFATKLRDTDSPYRDAVLPLVESVQSYYEYVAISPPPEVCPHS